MMRSLALLVLFALSAPTLSFRAEPTIHRARCIRARRRTDTALAALTLPHELGDITSATIARTFTCASDQTGVTAGALLLPPSNRRFPDSTLLRHVSQSVTTTDGSSADD